jgi:alkanesulfonate monooxygenase SsuD/methylene tetrahydromethanopterin reductase-like flavin-dependent oxidoreductase (luciferase family)
MKFGLLFRPQDPPAAENIAGRWQEILAAAKLAEDSGFDAVFIPEHHQMPDGYLPSPWAALGALAAVTDQIELGTSVHLPSLDHPVHVAEHAAMADILAEGRLRLGLGLGNFAPEFDLFGIDPKTQVSRFEETIEIVRRLWAGETLDWDSKHFKIKGNITPLPIGAEIWLGAMSDPGIDRAARLGAPWLADTLHNVNVIKRWCDMYRAAGAKYGTADDLGVVLIREGWIGDSMQQVEDVWWPHIRADHWFYVDSVPRWDAEREPFLASVEKEEDFEFERHRVDRLFVGTAADIIASIRQFQEAIDMDYMVISMRMGTGPGHAEEMEAIERYGREVIPAFR